MSAPTQLSRVLVACALLAAAGVAASQSQAPATDRPARVNEPGLNLKLDDATRRRIIPGAQAPTREQATGEAASTLPSLGVENPARSFAPSTAPRPGSGPFPKAMDPK